MHLLRDLMGPRVGRAWEFVKMNRQGSCPQELTELQGSHVLVRRESEGLPRHLDSSG